MRLRFMLSFEYRIKHLFKKRVARDAGKTVRGDHKHQGEGNFQEKPSIHSESGNP